MKYKVTQKDVVKDQNPGHTMDNSYIKIYEYMHMYLYISNNN